MTTLHGGTVTFVFTDIEGSTKLLERLGDRYAEALAEHRRIVRDAFAADASGLALTPELVARPRSPEEVVEVLRAASATGTPVTPAGALTGYSGGAVTDRGAVLSLRAMDRVLDLDPATGGLRSVSGLPGTWIVF